MTLSSTSRRVQITWHNVNSPASLPSFTHKNVQVQIKLSTSRVVQKNRRHFCFFFAKFAECLFLLSRQSPTKKRLYHASSLKGMSGSNRKQSLLAGRPFTHSRTHAEDDEILLSVFSRDY
uniref:(northern house mosquito) hypothetical protein n=1 Tax=Culex pipiens TaxID=7175 RepID=A0A8D8PDQ7_CULPI